MTTINNLRIRSEACKLTLSAMLYTGIDLIRMTIGWVEEFVRDGEVVDGFRG